MFDSKKTFGPKNIQISNLNRKKPSTSSTQAASLSGV